MDWEPSGAAHTGVGVPSESDFPAQQLSAGRCCSRLQAEAQVNGAEWPEDLGFWAAWLPEAIRMQTPRQLVLFRERQIHVWV